MAMKPSDLSANAMAALREGRKIDAVKIVREETGLELQAALTIVDAHLQADSLLRMKVDAVDAERKRRAIPVLIVAVLLVLVAAYVVFGK